MVPLVSAWQGAVRLSDKPNVHNGAIELLRMLWTSWLKPGLESLQGSYFIWATNAHFILFKTLHISGHVMDTFCTENTGHIPFKF